MKALKISLLVLTSYLMIGNAVAAEETLKFRLITRIISSNFIDTPVEGRRVGSMQSAGVAVFEDGRLADKQFALIMDNGGAVGTYSGYSIYTFQNGDTLTLKFTGGWGADSNGADYEVLSGTGAYEGATGTGRIDAAKEPWEKANLWDVTLNITRNN